MVGIEIALSRSGTHPCLGEHSVQAPLDLQWDDLQKKRQDGFSYDGVGNETKHTYVC